MSQPSRWRWAAIAVFTLYSALNYLDRNTLAALAPAVRDEFRLSNEDYGWLLSAFSVAYMLMSPLLGWFIDRVGLSLGSIVTMAVWSLAGAATGLTRSFSGLLGCRVILGAAESGGIPAFGKAGAIYLSARERALGLAVNQIGLSLGNAGAPIIAGSLAGQWGWRSAFVVTGALGFLWIPIWMATSRIAPVPAEPAGVAPVPTREILRDRRLWGMIVANGLYMTVYSLWMNWTTQFLVTVHHMPYVDANRQLAWIPPVFATLGGLFGGWLTWRITQMIGDAQKARLRVCMIGAVAQLVTAAVPFAPSALTATAAISASFFFCLVMSVNVYAMPQDLFGSARAAFAVSALTSAYGAMQVVYSPMIGRLVDRYGFAPVCEITAVLPLAAWAVLQWTNRTR